MKTKNSPKKEKEQPKVITPARTINDVLKWRDPSVSAIMYPQDLEDFSCYLISLRSFYGLNPAYDTRISCGVMCFSGLMTRVSAQVQAQWLAILLELHDGTVRPTSKRSFQILISDTIRSRGWEATKAIAYQGPVTTNPNSGNPIAVWIITKADIVSIFNYGLEKNEKKVGL